MKKILITVVLALMTLQAFAQGGFDRSTYDWGKFGYYEAANQALTQAPDVVFMGDSITEFWFRQHPDFFTSNNFAGRGISGQCSTQMLCRFQRDVVALNPKVVVINCGTNDIAGNNGKISHSDVVDIIKSMCDIAKSHGITPVLTSVLPCNHFFWNPEARPAEDIMALNILIREYADVQGLLYVDYHSAMTDATGALPKIYSEDGCHPVSAGYDKVEEIILPFIRKALDKSHNLIR